MDTNKKILMLASNCDSTNIVFNSIEKAFGIQNIIIEEKEGTIKFLKRRVKKLGFVTVVGQVFFQAIISKFLAITSQKRIAEIIKKENLNTNQIPENKIINVNSINQDSVVEIIQNLKPDLIIVNGTRIISKKILQCTTAKFINMHAGITPKYRGVHGAYWALANQDVANCGVTIHYVNEGIDTGNILNNTPISITPNDNFTTYPYLQLAAGNQLLLTAISAYFENTITEKKSIGESNLWYHPTAWQYLKNYFIKKVK